MRIINAFKQSSKQQRRTVIIIAILFVLLIGAIIIAYISYDSYQTRTHVSVTNYKSLNMPYDSRENLELQLRNALKKHFNAPDDQKITATIRKDTIEENDYSASFIIDIEAYKQTYQVTIEKNTQTRVSASSDGVNFKCTKKSLKKWPDVVCYGMYDNDYYPQLSNYLPYEDTASNGKKFIVKERKEASRKVIGLYVIACGNEKLFDEVEEKTKKYLTDEGLDASLYGYVRIDTCTAHNSN